MSHNQVDINAAGDINPGRFIAVVGNDSGDEATAATAERIVGISDLQSELEGSVLAASNGAAIPLQSGVVYFLELGGAVSAGNLITSDSVGRGVAASTGNVVRAVALESGVSGQLIKVTIAGPYTAP